MSPTKPREDEDVQETPPPVTVRDMWRDVRGLTNSVKELLTILNGVSGDDEKPGLVNHVRDLRKRQDRIDTIIYGAIGVILLSVLVAGLAYVIRNPANTVGASDPSGTAHTTIVGRQP